MATEQRGPDVGDEVEITVRGRIVAREMRDGVDSVAVQVSSALSPAWRAADEVVILDRQA